MPHIDLPVGVPGIRGAMQFRPETALHLNALAEELLRADNTLSRGDRELIAAYVSSRNKTVLCEHSHSVKGSKSTVIRSNRCYGLGLRVSADGSFLRLPGVRILLAAGRWPSAF